MSLYRLSYTHVTLSVAKSLYNRSLGYRSKDTKRFFTPLRYVQNDMVRFRSENET